MKGKVNAMKRAAITLLGFASTLSMAAVGQEVRSARAIAGEEQSRPTPNMTVLYGFANVSELPTLAEGPVKETCSHNAAASAGTSAAKAKPPTEDEDVKLANAVNKELTNKLENKEMSVIVAHSPDVPTGGSLVFTGCFVSADPGKPVKRLVGVGLGASHLSAHVRVFYVGKSGPVAVDEFDLAVKGSNKLPPLGAAGLTLNVVSEKRETLQADAKRLADGILKKLEKDEKNGLSGNVNLGWI